MFVHTGWSAKGGAPSNGHALAQTADGWLGTAQGLYRFDGVSFERYEPFQSSNITALLALRNGDLQCGVWRRILRERFGPGLRAV